MIRAQGYLLVSDPAGPSLERDSITCGHCQQLVFVKPGHGLTVYLVQQRDGWREQPGAFCRCCMKPVCLACHGVGTCTPWERRLAAMEQRQRFRESVGV